MGVCDSHKMKPHLFGMSLGCAVSIGVIDSMQFGSAASLTILDPFTSYSDTIFGWLKNRIPIFGWALGRVVSLCTRVTDSWESKARVAGKNFKDLPVCVLSGTKDTMIVPELHNQLYAAVARLDQVPPVATEHGVITSHSGHGDTPNKVLMEMEYGHIYSSWWTKEFKQQRQRFNEAFFGPYIVRNTQKMNELPQIQIKSVEESSCNWWAWWKSILISLAAWVLILWLWWALYRNIPGKVDNDPIGAIV